MFFIERGLSQNEAPFGRLQIDPLLIAAEQSLVIVLEVVTEEREAEPPLPLKGTVARATRAAELAHQR